MEQQILYLDTETRSPVDINLGVYRYVADPEFSVIMSQWALDDGPVRVEDGCPKEFLDLVRDPRIVKVAHNAAFDRVALSRASGLPLGEYLDPAEWRDTMHIARRAGLPGSLKDLASALGAEDKDTAGTRLINMFSKPQRDGSWVTPEDRPEDWARFREYGRQDVATLRDVCHRLAQIPADMRGGSWGLEHDVEILTERMNDRGIAVDADLVQFLHEQELQNMEAAYDRLVAITGLANPRSNQQFTAWLGGRGVQTPNLRRPTVTAMAEDDTLPEDVREACHLRVDLARAAGKKLDVLRRVPVAGRARGTFVYHGAATGRWSGRGIQPHNFSHATLPDGVEPEDLMARGSASPGEIAGAVRGCLAGPFVAIDYTSIEAVVLAWLAGEQWVLDAYADRRDLYVETAAKMSTAAGHDMTRAEGKVAVLGCGYGGGPNALRAFAGSGPTDEELREQVTAWRGANPSITALWQRLNDEFIRGQGDWISTSVDHDGDPCRVLHLPSGRTITYRKFRLIKNRFGSLSGCHVVPHKGRVETYGGRLVENLTQAVARDCLALAMVRMERAGMQPVLTVHDEVELEGPPSWWDSDVGVPTPEGVAAYRQAHEIMTEPIPWAPGLHLRAAGGVVPRFKKLADWEEIPDETN